MRSRGTLFRILLCACSLRCCSVRLVLLGVAPPTPAVAPSMPLKERGYSAQRQALKLVLLVEDGVWPEYTLHEEGTWAAHRKLLSLEQRHAEVKQPCASIFLSRASQAGGWWQSGRGCPVWRGPPC